MKFIKTIVDPLKFSTDLIEEKNQQIRSLEQKAKEISIHLTDLANNVKELIKLDDNYKEELNSILQRNVFDLAITQDPKIIFDFIKHCILNLIELKINLKQISTKSILKKNEDNEYNNDLMLIYHNLEAQLRNSLREEEHLRYNLMISKKQLDDIENKNKIFIEKTRGVLNEFREDYQKLLDVIKDKEDDIEELQKESLKKTDSITAMDEKLLTIYVLEFQIKECEKRNIKRLEEITEYYEEQIKDATDITKLHSYLYDGKFEKANTIKILEKNYNNTKLSKFQNLKEKDTIIQELQEELTNRKIILQKKNKELFQAKKNFHDKQKFLYFLNTSKESISQKVKLKSKIVNSYFVNSAKSQNFEKKEKNTSNIFLTTQKGNF